MYSEGCQPFFRKKKVTQQVVASQIPAVLSRGVINSAIKNLDLGFIDNNEHKINITFFFFYSTRDIMVIS